LAPFFARALRPGSKSGFCRHRIIFELLDDIPAVMPQESAAATWRVRYRGITNAEADDDHHRDAEAEG
jgi:hypothetical protein